MKIYYPAEDNTDTPSWVCGHWNGSPIEIGMGRRTEVGPNEIRHHHPYREYFIVLEGSAELEVEDSIVPIRAGMIVMIEPGERHKVVSVDLLGARWIVIKERSEHDTKYTDK